MDTKLEPMIPSPSPYIAQGLYVVKVGMNPVAIVQSNFLFEFEPPDQLKLVGLHEQWLLHKQAGARTLNVAAPYAVHLGPSIDVFPFPNRMPWTETTHPNQDSAAVTFEQRTNLPPSAAAFHAFVAGLPSMPPWKYVFSAARIFDQIPVVGMMPAEENVGLNPRRWREVLTANGTSSYLYAEDDIAGVASNGWQSALRLSQASPASPLGPPPLSASAMPNAPIPGDSRDAWLAFVRNQLSPAGEPAVFSSAMVYRYDSVPKLLPG